MTKRLTIEEVKYFIEVESNSGCKLESSEYKNNSSKLDLICKCGKPFKRSYGNFKSNNQRQCDDCSYILNFDTQRFKLDQVREKLSIYGFELLSDEYINSHSKLIMKDKDKYFYYTSLDIIRDNGSAFKFHKSNPYTIQNIKLWCRLNNKPFEIISDKWIRNDVNLKWRCLKPECDEIFEADWGHISNGGGCAVCYSKQITLSNCLATKRPDIASEWHPTKNGSLTPFMVSEYCNTKVWWQCEKGHEWEATVGHRSSPNGTNCPKCKKSKAERIVDDYLTNLKLNFKPQYKIKECKDKKQLPFDFAILDKNNNLLMLVEYDGELHYKPFRKAKNSQEKFEATVRHDKIKTNYCLENNIILIRIPYWDFDNIEIILEDILIHNNMDSKFIVNNKQL